MKKFIIISVLLACIMAQVIIVGLSAFNHNNIVTMIGTIGAVVSFVLLLDFLLSHQSEHISDEIYDDLRKQLEDWANDNENGTYNKKFAFSTDEATVNIEAELYKHNSKSKFRDEAWGHIKTCTEYNTYYRVTINDWVVTNRFGSEVDSDFDPEMIEMEVDGCYWE